ncbi:MAG: PHP domain-containing protein [Candidatus Omnitrophota bacterium]
MAFADLHLHTVFSDGTYTPAELVQRAAKNGLAAIAVVDHDTVGGIELSIEAGKASDLEVLPGIELSTELEDKEIHILGYLIDYKSPLLLEKLDFLKRCRIERVYKITDKLKEIGIDLKPEAVFDIAKEGVPGRLHIARAMVKQKIIRSTFEAFQKYIGDNCPAYVSGFKLSPSEGIQLIKAAKGVPVLAHPYSLNQDELIPQLVSYGLMGLEVYYPEHSQSMVNYYLDLAQKNGLLATGGSDCHGSAKPDIRIGLVKIPYELVEKLKQAKERL